MKRFLLVSVAALALSSCSLTPDYTRPDVGTPAAWHIDAKTGVNVTADWWGNFNSTELNALIIRALENNNDLRAGIHRIEQARASLKIAGADMYPSMDGSSNVSWSRNNPTSGKTTSENSGRAGVGVAYEVDLFGANQAAVDAATANVEGAVADRQALALTVMGDVATTYFTILNLNERIDIAESNLKISREVLRIVQAREDAGSVSGLEVAQQKTIVANTEAGLASIREQRVNAYNALAVLLGQPPQTVAVQAKDLSGVTLPAIAAGQPSDLLIRRPDIYSAEMDLIAANANIGAARAAFYPSLNLGLDWTIAASPLGDPTATALSLASALTAPIFQGGRLEGGLDQATARQLELAETYRKTVLVAFQEVEDALAAIRASGERQTAYETAAKESRRAWELSVKQYDAGLIDFQSLLDTQRSMLSADDTARSARLATYTAAITLFRALGGGWESEAMR